MSRKSFGKRIFFFVFFSDGTTIQCVPSPPQWTPPSQLRSLTSPTCNFAFVSIRLFTILLILHYLGQFHSVWLFRAHNLRFQPAFLPWRVVGLSPKPQPAGSVHRIYNPRGRVAQLYFQTPATHFGRLLRHAWAAVALFCGHHTAKMTTQ